MKVVSFHLKGKTAHFRKYYSNSSALSYFIPPRTTLIGIIAGLLGWERDSYYEMFSIEQCKIAIASCEPIKKTMQKLNYLKIEKVGELNGSNEYHSQTATELIIPQNIRTGIIDYQIWLHHLDNLVMERIESIIRDSILAYKSYGISIALGSAFNLGWIDSGQVSEGIEIKENSVQSVNSVIPVKNLREIKIEEIYSNSYRLIKEEIPLEFDKKRRITDKGLGYMIINLNSSPVIAEIENAIKLSNGQTISWMQ